MTFTHTLTPTLHLYSASRSSRATTAIDTQTASRQTSQDPTHLPPLLPDLDCPTTLHARRKCILCVLYEFSLKTADTRDGRERKSNPSQSDCARKLRLAIPNANMSSGFKQAHAQCHKCEEQILSSNATWSLPMSVSSSSMRWVNKKRESPIWALYVAFKGPHQGQISGHIRAEICS